jgi:oligopeptidase B
VGGGRRTAPGCRSRWCAARARRATAVAPALLYGYGSYEISRDPSFSIPVLSLLDRGFVYAIAHIRGGGEMGRSWYDRREAAAQEEHLHRLHRLRPAPGAARLDVTADRLVARGGSAGGLLMGAVANLAPEAFAGIVAQVPFVDALTTILDPSLPLTVTEWEEWGDPLHDPAGLRVHEVVHAVRERHRRQAYPPIFALTGLNDTRVTLPRARQVDRPAARVAKGGPFLLKTEMEAGHGGRSGRYDAWQEEALVLAWIVTTACGRTGG